MNIQTWQKQNNVSDVEMGKRVKVHPSFLSHIRNGRRRPSPKLALKIEKITGGAVTRDELLFPNLYGADE